MASCERQPSHGSSFLVMDLLGSHHCHPTQLAFPLFVFVAHKGLEDKSDYTMALGAAKLISVQSSFARRVYLDCSFWSLYFRPARILPWIHASTVLDQW